jgi:hypothetical protein
MYRSQFGFLHYFYTSLLLQLIIDETKHSKALYNAVVPAEGIYTVHFEETTIHPREQKIQNPSSAATDIASHSQ